MDSRLRGNDGKIASASQVCTDRVPGAAHNAFLTRNPYHVGLAVTSNCDLAPVVDTQHAHHFSE